MSVVGFDIGTINAVVATINRGSVIIVRNELSERTTPILVGYTESERLIGEAALSKLKSNYRNTCRYMKTLMGMLPNNLDGGELKYALASIETCEDGTLGYKVMYKQKPLIIYLTRVYATFLKRLKENTERSTNQQIRDLVVSIPGYYDNIARQNVLDALEIAGVQCLKLMNEESAVALDYGIFRSSSFGDNDATNVALVNCGAGYFFTSIVKFTKGKFNILATIYERKVSGRSMDNKIIEFVAQEFNDKHKINILDDLKARIKLEDAATRCKKILSANQEANFIVECVYGEYDINMIIERSKFEELCSDMRNDIYSMIKNALKQASLNTEEISSIEIVGGCSRIPWVQKVVSDAFGGRELCKTLNADETVARGCALQAAMLSPIIKVREFSMTERFPYEILLFWQNTTNLQDFKSTVLFSSGSDLNVLKNSTFTKTEPFEVFFRYSPSNMCPSLDLGRYLLQIPVQASQGDAKVKLYIRLDRNGILVLERVELIREEKVIEPYPSPETGSTATGEEEMHTNPGVEVPTNTSTKTRVKRSNVPFTIISKLPGYLTTEDKALYIEEEKRMSLEDLEVHLTREKLNELETYVFDMRSKLSPGSILYPFGEKETINEFVASLARTEDWIYDNYAATRNIFEQKLMELRSFGDPIERRFLENNQLKEIQTHMNSLFEHFNNICTNPDTDFTPESKAETHQGLISKYQEFTTSLKQNLEGRDLYQELIVPISTLRSLCSEIQDFCNQTLKPLPKTQQEVPYTGDQEVQEPKLNEDVAMDTEMQESKDETNNETMEIE
ncbi:DnaK family protein [Cryptosporidium muris RN66]|uniref:DnaK family protein n=1 Tax=Cryptosporidium muris (strain RN66) TaxID=441375 RepID=B6AD80_CRYMR|nr:DnaK family protein [Cryptosporidium muris RN66]EEA06084.1 DnaK family protein [Cryptosporidium muris RN66]|eukprot:XP_002140433.1 DnaK family protein [Cryptosporidium muris RN66]